MKTCTKCGLHKTKSAFYRKRTTRDGYAAHCKDCANRYTKEWYQVSENRERVLRRQVEYSRQNRPKEFARNLMRMYGLTVDRYYSMLVAQLFKCAICDVRFGEEKALRPHVDHDHETGKVRGLLCSSCNIAIGLLHDDVNLIRSAENYVEQGGFRCDMFSVQK